MEKVIMVDQSHIGTVFEPFEAEVEKGAIIKFADAIGDGNPLYSDGKEDLEAPPTFGTTFRPPKGFLQVFQDLDIDLTRVLHGEEEYEYFKPIKPGDLLTCQTIVSNVYEKSGKSGGMTFVTMETECNNASGELVLIQRSTTVVRH